VPAGRATPLLCGWGRGADGSVPKTTGLRRKTPSIAANVEPPENTLREKCVTPDYNA
jgi:hypothetical protein